MMTAAVQKTGDGAGRILFFDLSYNVFDICLRYRKGYSELEGHTFIVADGNSVIHSKMRGIDVGGTFRYKNRTYEVLSPAVAGTVANRAMLWESHHTFTAFHMNMLDSEGPWWCPMINPETNQLHWAEPHDKIGYRP